MRESLNDDEESEESADITDDRMDHDMKSRFTNRKGGNGWQSNNPYYGNSHGNNHNGNANTHRQQNQAPETEVAYAQPLRYCPIRFSFSEKAGVGSDGSWRLCRCFRSREDQTLPVCRKSSSTPSKQVLPRAHPSFCFSTSSLPSGTAAHAVIVCHVQRTRERLCGGRSG